MKTAQIGFSGLKNFERKERKRLARTIRFEGIYRRLMFDPDTSLTDLAYEFGYTDQAHFIRDFKEFAIKTPGEFAAQMLGYKRFFTTTRMSYFYNCLHPDLAKLAADPRSTKERYEMDKLKLFCVVVNDYDETIQFYTQKLGFEVAEDAAFGDNRWITLKLPNTPDSNISLALAKTEEDKAIVGKQAGSFSLLGLGTADCLADYSRMKERGVKFHGEPQGGPWGTGILLEDLYGNKIFMSQEP